MRRREESGRLRLVQFSKIICVRFAKSLTLAESPATRLNGARTRKRPTSNRVGCESHYWIILLNYNKSQGWKRVDSPSRHGSNGCAWSWHSPMSGWFRSLSRSSNVVGNTGLIAKRDARSVIFAWVGIGSTGGWRVINVYRAPLWGLDKVTQLHPQ